MESGGVRHILLLAQSQRICTSCRKRPGDRLSQTKNIPLEETETSFFFCGEFFSQNPRQHTLQQQTAWHRRAPLLQPHTSGRGPPCRHTWLSRPFYGLRTPLFTYIRLPLHPGISGEIDICDFPGDVIELGPEILRRDLYTHNKDILRSSFYLFLFFAVLCPQINIICDSALFGLTHEKNKKKTK